MRKSCPEYRTWQSFKAQQRFARGNLADTGLQPEISQATKDQPYSKTDAERCEHGMSLAAPNHNTDRNE